MFYLSVVRSRSSRNYFIDYHQLRLPGVGVAASVMTYKAVDVTRL